MSTFLHVVHELTSIPHFACWSPQRLKLETEEARRERDTHTHTHSEHAKKHKDREEVTIGNGSVWLGSRVSKPNCLKILKPKPDRTKPRNR